MPGDSRSFHRVSRNRSIARRAGRAGPSCAALLGLLVAAVAAGDPSTVTFSIVAYDSTASQWGVAAVSAGVACGALVPSARAGAGAIAAQGLPGPGLGPRGLSILERGAGAVEALDSLWAGDESREGRQLTLVDAHGRAAGATGRRAPSWAGHRIGRGYACQGSGLRAATDLEAAARAFEFRRGPLAERLLAALGALPGSDGASSGLRSAALLVVRSGGGFGPLTDRWVDLRVDAASEPLAELGRAYALWAETLLPAAHARLGDEAKRLGLGAEAEKEYRLAEDGFREAVARGPKNADALNELAWFLATHDREPAQAVRFAEAAVLARPGDPNLLDTLAEAHLRAGSLERAIAAAERAVGASATGAPAYAARLARLKAARAALKARADSVSTEPTPPSR